MFRPTIGFLALGFLLGCNSDHAMSGLGSGSRLTLINGAAQAGTVTLYIDNHRVGDIVVAQAKQDLALDPGSHHIELRRSNGTMGLSSQLDFIEGAGLTIVALDSAGLIRSAELADSNTVVPPGATKLRVAHFAQAAGNIDIWRTQPDFVTPIRIMFPFTYHDISPYVQSTPGDWRVLVSTAINTPNGPMPDTLGMTGLIAIAGGASRTVLVVDNPAGGVELLVVDP
ncbi:MAG: DUF4397 domain-containing protein [Gemmatimonadota bacterium]